MPQLQRENQLTFPGGYALAAVLHLVVPRRQQLHREVVLGVEDADE